MPLVNVLLTFETFEKTYMHWEKKEDGKEKRVARVQQDRKLKSRRHCEFHRLRSPICRKEHFYRKSSLCCQTVILSGNSVHPGLLPLTLFVWNSLYILEKELHSVWPQPLLRSCFKSVCGKNKSRTQQPLFVLAVKVLPWPKQWNTAKEARTEQRAVSYCQRWESP